MGIIAKRTILFHLCMHAAIRMMQQFVELTGVGCQHTPRDFTFVSFSLLVVVVVFFGIGAF